MNEIRVAHTADVHGSKEGTKSAKSNQSLAELAEQGKTEKVDLFAISGDFWDSPIQNTEGAGFPETVSRIAALADIAPVAMIYGTPSHDAEGSLEIFEQLATLYGITILRPGKAYFFAKGRITDHLTDDSKMILFGIPEPSKKWLMAGQEAEGKEAAEAASRKALSMLCMGLGGLRAKHMDIPCITLYHGQVGGARLQNGQAIDTGSGMAISIDDLRYIGANYYALGDIHEPQKVGDLNAYYPGSVYPCNWGETHQAGWNLVTILDFIMQTKERDGELFRSLPDKTVWDVTVTRKNFSHPPQHKISARIGDGFNTDQISGKLVWIEYTVTREESSVLDLEVATKHLLESGALQGSQVTMYVLPTETVRAAEIADAPRLRDKVKIWRTNSGQESSEELLSMADDLEAEAQQAGLVTHGASIQMQKLILRGAIGIWKNSRRDEVVLDFEELDAGIIALIGHNGAGKTTIIENMHPWPCMLTRRGTLKDHFRLRDSFRDLYFIDDATGTEYRTLIQINAAVKTGTTEYFIYERSAGAEWAPMVGSNGRQEPYLEFINRLFGSLQLFLKSAFVSQKATDKNRDIADSNSTERVELMSELCGLAYFDAYQELARKHATALDREVMEGQAKLKVLNESVSREDDLLKELHDSRVTLETAKERLTQLQADGDAINKTIETLSAQAEAQGILSRSRAEVEQQIIFQTQEINQLKQSIQDLEKAISGREAAADQVAGFERLTQEVTRERQRKSEHDRAENQKLVEFQNQQKAHGDIARTLRVAEAETNATLRDVGLELALHQAKIDNLRAELAKPIVDTCNTCGQLLPAAKRSELELFHKEQSENLEYLVFQEEKMLEAQKRSVQVRNEATTAITDHEAMAPKQPPADPFDDTEIRRIEAELEWIDIEVARKTVSEADTAAGRLVDIRKYLVSLEASLAELKTKMDEISAKLDSTVNEKLSVATTRRTELRNQYQSENTTFINASATVKAAEADLARIGTARDQIAEESTKIAATIAIQANWALLDQACGKKGIQALELDAVAPSIAQVANDLLKSAYDSRYTIEFSTTKTGSAGTQLETFDIFVSDAETGIQQEISTLSGGESVWIKRALYDAFAAIRARNTNLRFQTVFQDEADGALDSEAKERYFRMLESAHRQSGRHQTVIITHSREVQDMASQKVDVATLTGRPEEPSQEVAA